MFYSVTSVRLYKQHGQIHKKSKEEGGVLEKETRCFRSPLAMTQLTWEPGTWRRMRKGVTLALESNTVSSAPTRRPAETRTHTTTFRQRQRQSSGHRDIYIHCDRIPCECMNGIFRSLSLKFFIWFLLKCLYISIHPFIHTLSVVLFLWGSRGEPELIPADTGREAGFTLDGSPAYHRLYTQRQPTIYNYMVNLETLINPTPICMSVDRRRKLEKTTQTHILLGFL